MLSPEERERLGERYKSKDDSMSRDSCFPVKTVTSSRYPQLAGIYILYGKFPHKKNKLCHDHCVYITVSEATYVVIKTTSPPPPCRTVTREWRNIALVERRRPW